MPSVLKKNRGDVLCRSVLSLFFRRSSGPTFRWRIHTESDQSSRPTQSASERLIGPQSCVLCSYVKSRQAASISNSEQRLTFFGDSFFSRSYCSFPSLPRLPRRSPDFPEEFLFSRLSGILSSISFAIPKVSFSPICRERSSLLPPTC